MDEQTRGFLNVAAASGNPPLHEMPLEEARVGLKEMTLAIDAPFSEVAKRKQTTIPGPLGDIPVRIYWPREPSPDESLPVLLFFHGGGFALGDLDTHENVCRFYCNEVQCIVINVGYRLAPEYRYPAAVDDCYAALCWTAENASQLGGDRDRIAVSGDSAGGNLAALLCLMARDRKGPAIAFQALLYPVLTMDPEADYPSREQFGNGEFMLSIEDMRWFMGMYLNEESYDEEIRMSSPMLVESLEDLPQALVITAGFDPLRDEGKAYFEKLVQDGVKAEYRCFETTIHGFMSFSGLVEAGREGLQMVADRLGDALGGP